MGSAVRDGVRADRRSQDLSRERAARRVSTETGSRTDSCSDTLISSSAGTRSTGPIVSCPEEIGRVSVSGLPEPWPEWSGVGFDPV